MPQNQSPKPPLTNPIAGFIAALLHTTDSYLPTINAHMLTSKPLACFDRPGYAHRHHRSCPCDCSSPNLLCTNTTVVPPIFPARPKRSFSSVPIKPYACFVSFIKTDARLHKNSSKRAPSTVSPLCSSAFRQLATPLTRIPATAVAPISTGPDTGNLIIFNTCHQSAKPLIAS